MSMVVFAMEHLDGYALAHLSGSFEFGAQPSVLVEHLELAWTSGPLVVDLTDVRDLDRPAVQELLLRLEDGGRRGAVVLVCEDLDHRRTLRAMTGALPVLPSVAQAVDGQSPLGSRIASSRH